MAYNIKDIINKNWDILLSNAFLCYVFSKPPRFCFRRAPTLKDSLVRSHLPAPKSRSWFLQPKGTYRCGSHRHCHNIKKDNVFKDVFSQKTASALQIVTRHTLYTDSSVNVDAFMLATQKESLKKDWLNTSMP